MTRQQGVLICFAVKEEARYFKPSLTWPTAVRVTITGMGRDNASRSFQNCIQNTSPQSVLTCGFAGGLNPQLQRGTIIFSADDDLGLSPALLQLGAKPVRFHCHARVVVTSAEKRQLWESTHADAVEMESGVIRQLCRERGIPSATVRVVSDSAEEDLPLDFNTVMTPEQKLNYFKLITQLLRTPSRIPAVIRLHKNTAAASERLAQFLRALLERECFE